VGRIGAAAGKREFRLTTMTESPPATAAPATTSSRPRMVIEPPSAWAALNLHELWHFRELLWNLAVRDVKLRYRQTALGVTWVILQPLLGAAIFAFLFGKVGQFEPPADAAGRRPPYLLFALGGMMCWQVFSGTLTRSSGTMVGNAHLVSKVYFPRILLPLGTLSSTLLDFAVTLAFLFVLFLFRWYFPGLNVLLMPLCLLLICALALGVGVCATALSVSFRDVQYVVPVMTQLLFYLSPVAYSVEKVMHRLPPGLRPLYYLNPMAALLEAFQWSVLSVGRVHWGWFTYSAAVSVVMLVVGAYVFSRMERRFADVV
jgi:lipopolysaccharide transport system permease protein